MYSVDITLPIVLCSDLTAALPSWLNKFIFGGKWVTEEQNTNSLIAEEGENDPGEQKGDEGEWIPCS